MARTGQGKPCEIGRMVMGLMMVGAQGTVDRFADAFSETKFFQGPGTRSGRIGCTRNTGTSRRATG
ncbi:MAG: hypothetical protein D6690_13735 [Nitrospirae bacterium]|nr:MAG: hypothetical protein D6690_13735 [Nitrospirota bacterium]